MHDAGVKTEASYATTAGAMVAIHVAAFAMALFTAVTSDGLFRITNDACQYYQTGVNLANHRGLTFNGTSCEKFPPLYPVFVAMVVRAGGTCRSLQVANCVLTLGAYWLGWRLLRNQGVSPVPAGLMSLTATTALLCTTAWVLSEPLYTVLSLSALLLLDQAASGRSSSIRRVWTCCLAGAVLACLAAQTRSLGAALGLAFLATMILQKRPRRHIAAAFGVAFVVIAPVAVWILRNQPADSDLYADPNRHIQAFLRTDWTDARSPKASPKQLAQRTLQQAGYAPLYAAEGSFGLPLFHLLKRVTDRSAPAGAVAHGICLCLIAGPLVWGLAGHLRRSRGVSEVYLCIYLVAVLVYGCDAGSRFYHPVAVLLLWCAVAHICHRDNSPQRGRLAVTVLLFLAAIGVGAWAGHLPRRNQQARAFVDRATALADARAAWERLGRPPLCSRRFAEVHFAFGVPVRPCTSDPSSHESGLVHVYLADWTVEHPAPPDARWLVLWQSPPVWLVRK
jgi:hypothetical protein